MEVISYEWWNMIFRWAHILSGIMWIGHLYYFNFTQTPMMPRIPAEQRPAVSGFIAPTALFWFRWGAAATIVFGLIVAAMSGFLGQAIALGIGSHDKRFTAIGFGMWIGTIMFLNVWLIIWPHQKKILGIVTATPEERTRSARIAGLASRINTMLSIPMLYGMVANHFYS